MKPETLINKCIRRILKFVLEIFYNIQIQGTNNIPTKDGVIIAANHESFLDALVLCAYIDRPIRFLTWYRLFHHRFIGWVLRVHQDIPVNSGDRAQVKLALDQCSQVIRDGDVLGIFPEGGLTLSGEIGVFKNGIIKIWDQTPAPIVPVALSGFWDTIFSRKNKNIWWWLRTARPHRKTLQINIGVPVYFSSRPESDDIRGLVNQLKRKITN